MSAERPSLWITSLIIGPRLVLYAYYTIIMRRMPCCAPLYSMLTIRCTNKLLAIVRTVDTTAAPLNKKTLTGLRTTPTPCCACMLLSRKRISAPPALYLNTQSMEVVRSYKYLGVIVSSDLSWSSHIQLVCMKAKKILGLIYRNFAKYTSDSSVILKIYKALVRPHLEYAAQVWSLYTVKDIELLEKVQRFALRICSRNYNLSYEELLDLCKIPSLQNRRSFLSLCILIIIHGFVFFPPHSLPLVSNSRTHHPSFYRTPFAHTSALQHSFMYTALSLFNNLSYYDATESTSLNRFKYFISPLFL